MADEKAGMKPEKEGGAGAEKDEAESAESAEGTEAGGRRHHHRHHHRVLYTCYNDGVGNYVHGNWNWFTCWRCGALNYM